MHEYNEELLDPVKEYARWTVIGLTILSFILCILSLKWRFIIHSFLYLECTSRIVASFIPNVYNEVHSNIDLTMLNVIFCIAFYTHSF